MGKNRYTPEQIIRKLHEVEVLISQGMKTPQAARQAWIVEHTFYRWRKEYGGIRIDQAKRLKVLEKENLQLKKLVAEKELDIQIYRDTLAIEMTCPRSLAQW